MRRYAEAAQCQMLHATVSSSMKMFQKDPKGVLKCVWMVSHRIGITPHRGVANDCGMPHVVSLA